MRFQASVLALCFVFFSTTAALATPGENHRLVRTPVDGRSLVARGSEDDDEQRYQGKCKKQKVVYRKEWRALSHQERKKYTDAVRCLKSKKPALYAQEVPGTQSRYDDFQVLHINQTFIIHLNAQFLAWHRWFTWAYEQALRDDCGYTGFQPYWDWTLDAQNIDASPLFDGSPHSMSGNGAAIPHPDPMFMFNVPGVPPVAVTLPAGTGGGCVTKGPFADFVVPFGEVNASIDATLLNNPNNLAPKPHCLRRDLTRQISNASLTQEAVDTVLRSADIATFQNALGRGSSPGVLGVHGAGHYAVGRDMSDTFSSPGDPIFYLHHAQIDRIWAIWQARDRGNRQYAISGTGTLLNFPPSPEFKLTDTIDLGRLSPEGPRPLKDLMSTTGGPFCYEYV